MSETTNTSSTFRLEDRSLDGRGVDFALCLRDNGFGQSAAEQAWRRFRHELTLHPTRYTPTAGRRLVLLAVKP